MAYLSGGAAPVWERMPMPMTLVLATPGLGCGGAHSIFHNNFVGEPSGVFGFGFEVVGYDYVVGAGGGEGLGWGGLAVAPGLALGCGDVELELRGLGVGGPELGGVGRVEIDHLPVGGQDGDFGGDVGRDGERERIRRGYGGRPVGDRQGDGLGGQGGLGAGGEEQGEREEGAHGVS